jgi:hypothetical protein
LPQMPANIRVSAQFPFPAGVAGGAPIVITKANGIWTISLNIAALGIQNPPSSANFPTDYLLVYDSLAKTFLQTPLSALAKIAGTAFQVNTQIFTLNGSYVPTPGMLYADAQCVGGGAGGGGTPTTGAGQNSAGGGGGSGGYARGVFSASIVGASKSVVIGGGGSGGVGLAGNNAGNTTFGGTFLVAGGGLGGPAGIGGSTSSISGGASGGASSTSNTTGDGVAVLGQSGWDGWSFATLSQGGGGGSSVLGAGGTTAMTGPGSVIGGVGAAGPGGGGSGAAAGASQGVGTGGSGASGTCIITEYIL